MRERITLLQKLGQYFDPSTLDISDGSIRVKELRAGQEDRLTLDVEELPDEIQTLLRSCRALHIRWVSLIEQEIISPLLSRLPPGFHVFYSPATESDASSEELCILLNKAFGNIGCRVPAEAFTPLPDQHFSRLPTLQYHQPLENLSRFAYYVKDLCPAKDPSCVTKVGRLVEAVSLDVSYDASSREFKVTALWPYRTQVLHVTSRPGFRTEVGILSADKPAHLKSYELGISGVLTVLDRDTKRSTTAFTFPARHRDAESTFSAKFLQPTGLHPTLQLQVESSKPPIEDANCSAHAYLTLPKTIFADRYQLEDSLFLASKNLRSLRYMSQPVDLEAPDYDTQIWGSTIALELAPPFSSVPQRWTAAIPLHLRYMSPAHGGYSDIQVPYPAVFWTCTAGEGIELSNSPFDRVNLGYDRLFGPRTAFWHVKPRLNDGSGRLISTVKVPVLDLDRSGWVNFGTAAAVALGFSWICWKLLAVILRSGYGNEPAGRARHKKRQ